MGNSITVSQEDAKLLRAYGVTLEDGVSPEELEAARKKARQSQAEAGRAMSIFHRLGTGRGTRVSRPGDDYYGRYARGYNDYGDYYPEETSGLGSRLISIFKNFMNGVISHMLGRNVDIFGSDGDRIGGSRRLYLSDYDLGYDDLDDEYDDYDYDYDYNDRVYDYDRGDRGVRGRRRAGGNGPLRVRIDAPKDRMYEYSVVKGDNLTQIAKRFGTTVDEIMLHNDIADANKITVDQKINIPKGTRTYTVQSGQTLAGIAKDAGCTEEDIRNATVQWYQRTSGNADATWVTLQGTSLSSGNVWNGDGTKTWLLAGAILELPIKE